MAALARRVLPWLVAVGCLVWAFRIVPIADCLAALRGARLEVFLPLALSAVATWFLIDSAAYAYAFSRFNTPLSWRDARALRALTYLLTVLHWHVAKAAIVLRLNTTHGVGLVAGASTLLLYQTIGMLVLALFAIVGAWVLPPGGPRDELLTLAGLFAAGLLAALFLLRRDGPRIALLDTLRRAPLLRAHHDVGLRDVLVIGSAKAAYQALFVFVYFVGLRAFGLSPSLVDVLVATPILQAIGGLPIAPAGFGTQQAAILFLFSSPEARGSDGPALLAFALALPITTLTARCGLACLYLGELSPPSRSASASATSRV